MKAVKALLLAEWEPIIKEYGITDPTAFHKALRSLHAILVNIEDLPTPTAVKKARKTAWHHLSKINMVADTIGIDPNLLLRLNAEIRVSSQELLEMLPPGRNRATTKKQALEYFAATTLSLLQNPDQLHPLLKAVRAKLDFEYSPQSLSNLARSIKSK